MIYWKGGSRFAFGGGGTSLLRMRAELTLALKCLAPPIFIDEDHRFLDSFLTLLGAVLASADTFEAKLRFARFIGIVSGEENTYFLRAFEALSVAGDRRAADPDTQ